MFILRVSLDPESEGSLEDLGEPLEVRLRRPLEALSGIDLVAEIEFAPDDRSALVPILVADDVDVASPELIGTRLVNVVEGDLAETAFNVELFMAATPAGRCAICGMVDAHDLSKHVVSADYAVGLTQL